jgi:hypothetical protein
MLVAILGVQPRRYFSLSFQVKAEALVNHLRDASEVAVARGHRQPSDQNEVPWLGGRLTR